MTKQWIPLEDGWHEGLSHTEQGVVMESCGVTVRGNTLEVSQFAYGSTAEAVVQFPKDTKLCRLEERTKTRNSEMLQSFVDFCENAPDLHFWQALAAWCGR